MVILVMLQPRCGRSQEQVTACWSTIRGQPVGQARTVPVTGERLALCKSVMVLFDVCVRTAGLSAFLHLPSRGTDTLHHDALAGTRVSGAVVFGRQFKAEQVVDRKEE